MPFNHSEAEKIVSMTDVKRYDAGLGSRAAALMGDDNTAEKKDDKKAAPRLTKPTKNNVVVAEMKSKEFTQAYAPVFAKLHDAVAAAERACQNPEEGVKSKQEADRLLERTLNDLLAVVVEVRDERKEIIRDRSHEEQSHPYLVA